jgi:hypothetical protein
MRKAPKTHLAHEGYKLSEKPKVQFVLKSHDKKDMEVRMNVRNFVRPLTTGKREGKWVKLPKKISDPKGVRLHDFVFEPEEEGYHTIFIVLWHPQANTSYTCLKRTIKVEK